MTWTGTETWRERREEMRDEVVVAEERERGLLREEGRERKESFVACGSK